MSLSAISSQLHIVKCIFNVEMCSMTIAQFLVTTVIRKYVILGMVFRASSSRPVGELTC